GWQLSSGMGGRIPPDGLAGFLRIRWQLSPGLGGRNHRNTHTAHRRHQALDRYLADEKIEDICRHLACAKSWLYKWRKRYDATHPAWGQERSTRPKHSPTHTPAHVVQAVVSLYVTLRQNGTGDGVTAIMQALTQQGIEPVPSRSTIYHILHRYYTGVTEHRSRASTP
ncbi:MAG: helix-turn-helix domain-containing protein, partial [Candidatus Tectomicrobia bacterium]|nr:helix-turn-helix domain-containing protein [Candidatus Tectomicrobia bacterium]